jgi:putative hydrolase of the HAD superfamily
VIKAIVSDFGGVVTLPLNEAFARAHNELGIPIDALGKAMRRATAHAGEPPIYALERGEITEAQFMATLGASLEAVLGHPVNLDGYGRRLMGELTPNEPLLDYYRALRARGLRLAICTNNVREWQPRWRTAEIDALFELVVDSGFEGTRKPEPAIYAIVLARLGMPAEACVFVDDLEVNVTGARDAGMHGVHFRDTAQAVAEIDALLAQFSVPSRSQM